MDNLPQTNRVTDEEPQHSPKRVFRLKKVTKSRWRVQETDAKKYDNRYCSTGERKFTPWIFIWHFLAHICTARVFMLDSALTPAR